MNRKSTQSTIVLLALLLLVASPAQAQKEQKTGLQDVSDFPTVRARLETTINSGTSNIGDLVEATLLEPYVENNTVKANTNDRLRGEVSDLVKARKTIKSYVPGKNFGDAQGRISLVFKRIVAPNDNIPIVAKPLPGSVLEPATETKTKIAVNKRGEFVLKYNVWGYQAFDLGVGLAAVAAGPAAIVAAPILTGTVGASKKDYAMGRPVDDVEKTSRVKGFMLGAARAVPGGSVISGVATSGRDIQLNTGDQIVLQVLPCPFELLLK